MAITTKNRKQLKSYFVKNAIPTEGNFADLIDGALNQAEDGVFKLANEPLSVVAAPGEQKRTLRFYANYPAPNADWHISLSPAQDPSNPATVRPGFGITDGAGNTRLYIDPATGNVGLGTNNPADRLTVTGGDVLIEGGRYRRLKIVSDSYWAGIELVARGVGEAGHPHIDFTNGDLGNPNFGLRLVGIDNKTLQLEGVSGQATLTVRGDITYDGQQSKLDVKEQGAVVLRVHDLLLGHPARRGQPGLALVDATDALVVNFAKDWSRTEVHGPLVVAGDTTVQGTTFAPGGLSIIGAVPHIETDGALYRHTDGQVYLTVDDNLYLRNQGSNSWAAHFQTHTGDLALRGKLVSERAGVGTTDPQGPLEVRVPGVGGWDRFVVTTSPAWGDNGAQYVTIGAGGAHGIMFNNPHVPWIAAESRASIRYGRSGGQAAGAFWDVGARPDNMFTFDSSTAGRLMSFTDNGKVTVHNTLEVGGSASLGLAQTSADYNKPLPSGFYQHDNPAGRVPDPAHPWVHMINVRHANLGNHHALQIASSYAQNDRLFFRKIARDLTPADNAWNEVATVTGGVLKIGDWALAAEGNNLVIRKSGQPVARFSVEWDRFQIYRNLNGAAPYFFFNAGGGSGVHNG